MGSVSQLGAQLESTIRSAISSSHITNPWSVPALPPPPPTCMQAARDTQRLRQALAQPTAVIRGDAQGRAISAFVQAERHTLFVAATGSGKSLLPLLATRETESVTLIIAPYVALRADLHARGASVEPDNYHLWRQLADDGAHAACPTQVTGVVVATPDEAATKAFKGWLGTVGGEGRLRRVVVDEAHVLLTEASFRGAVAELRHISVLHVPLFLTTATLPVEEEPLLAACLGIAPPDLVVIRGPVARPNLAFKVKYQPHKLCSSTLH